jgi:SAM-dependent methyltransferase
MSHEPDQFARCYFCEQIGYRSKRRRAIFFNQDRQYFFCKPCKAFSLYPKLQSSDFDQLYSTNYIESFSSDSGETLEFSRFMRLKEFLESHSDLAGKKFLDFGCGSSAELLIYGQNLKLTCVGVEVEKSTRELATINSGSVVLSPEEFFKSELKFDYIFIGDVLEHINNPTTYLTQLALHLNPQGYLFIQGPLESAPTLSNKLVEIKSLLLNGKRVNFPPYHVTLASMKTIERIMSFSGLYPSQLVVRETWWPTSRKALFHPIQNTSSWAIAVCKIFDLLLSFVVPKYGTRFEVICQKLDLK